ncbi:MAG: AMP-binding protein [Microscillaceae bacterium]|nr:AMP-binding protein [Microscillaceae bacterium]
MDHCGLPTLIEHFYKWEQQKPHAVYLRQPIGDLWIEYTWREVGEQARRMAMALKAMDLAPKSHIGIISKNCAHWVMSDLAIMMAGHISVPFFPTLTADQLQAVLEHSDTQVLFVGKLDSWDIMKAGIPASMPVITYPPYSGGAPVAGDHFLKWDDLMAQYPALQNNYIPQHADLMTICYTSGTTGVPKGVMLSYYAFATLQESVKDQLGNELPEIVYFSYLPLNHMAERLVVESASLASGGMIAFAESLDTFARNLAETRPTHFLAVPRIWTKFQQGVFAKIPPKKLNRLFKIPILSGMIKKKIKKTLGLDRAKYVLTGAAPMPEALFRWYRTLGVPIREGYGMSENTAACTSMRLDRIKFGTVGEPQEGVELKIDPNTGEILMKCEWVMEGYYKQPELTAQVLRDGWLYTGDRGRIDEDGFLIITGRVKELFKTAKGEYVSPFTLESGFATNPDIEQICVVGAGMPQPMALVVLSDEGKKKARKEIEDGLMASLSEVNGQVFPYERIQRLIIVPDAWNVETGIMTPTLKIKRNAIEDKYGAAFEKWFDRAETFIWA